MAQFRCQDCVYHYEPHEKNHKGEFFLAKCKFSKWSVFLDQPQCKEFKHI